MDIVDRLVELVRIPSVSGNEKAICDAVQALAARAKPEWPARRLGNNLVVGPAGVGDAGGSGGRPRIGLVGHLDTVPPQDNAEPELRDDMIYGRGSTDMKAGVAVMCDLLETLSASDLPVDLTFVFYDNEEAGFDENGLGKLLPAVPELAELDFAFVLEPTELTLEVGCSGHINLEVNFRGRSAHSARPWMGENAIHKAGPFISKIGAIEMREARVGEAVYKEVVSITQVTGGIARNVVPDRIRFNLNYRFPPGRDLEEAERYLYSLLPEDADARIIDKAPPGPVPEGNSVLESFRERFAPTVRAKQGWTDVARLGMHGVDAVNFGPGIPELCHRKDEHVSVELLRRCREMLYEFLTSREVEKS